MSFASFFTSTHETVDLVLDIGSGSVGATLLVCSENKNPTSVFTVRKPIAFQKKLDPKRLAKLLDDTLLLVLDSVLKDGIKHLRFTKSGAGAIRNVHVVLAAPWYSAHANTVVVKKDTVFTVSNQLLSEYILEEQKEFIASIPAHAEQFQEGVRPVEHAVIHVRLNGYETATPIGKTAHELSMSLYVSVMSEYIATSINNLNYDPGLLLITHYQRILHFIHPDFVHIMIQGKLVKSGNAELAKEVEEKGYEGYLT